MSMTNDHNSDVVGRLVGANKGRRVHGIDDADAALSLCALGSQASSKPFRSNEIKAFHSLSIELPTSTTRIVTPPVQSPIGQSIVQNLSNLSLEMSPLSIDRSTGHYIITLSPKKSKPTEQHKAAAVAAPLRKNNMKPKDPKRDTSVSFEEMKRLMRVYGPIKALRSRAVKDAGKAAKPGSIRRKFYRWFPDFNERFVKTSDGWYSPKDGHQEEMIYREAMRKMDKEVLVKKRNDTRFNGGVIGNNVGIQTSYY